MCLGVHRVELFGLISWTLVRGYPNTQNCTCLFTMVRAVGAGAALAILNDHLTFRKSGTVRVKI